MLIIRIKETPLKMSFPWRKKRMFGQHKNSDRIQKLKSSQMREPKNRNWGLRSAPNLQKQTFYSILQSSNNFAECLFKKYPTLHLNEHFGAVFGWLLWLWYIEKKPNEASTAQSGPGMGVSTIPPSLNIISALNSFQAQYSQIIYYKHMIKRFWKIIYVLH